MAWRVKQLYKENGQTGSVFSISGPIIIAENMRGSCMYELVSDYESNMLRIF
jgi:V-type H+-transporting ATPase subunit A